MVVREQRGVRLVIGRDKQTLTAQEMQQREIVRITRLIVKLERKRRNLRGQIKTITKELKILRRAQRVVLAPSFHPEEFDSQEIRK